MKRLHVYASLLVGTFMTPFAFAEGAAPTDITGLISAFDFSSAEQAMYAGGAAVLGITVVVLGIQKVISMLRGAGR